MDDHKQYRLPLDKQLNTTEQEGRMVLPGIQAIFGFQLIAVFNQGFKAYLTSAEQYIHLAALILVSLSALLVLTPAAYHRESCRQLSLHFVALSSRFLGLGMVPLALGLCLDLYVVAKVVSGSVVFSASIALVIAALYFVFWYLLPSRNRKKIHEFQVQDFEPQKPSH